MFLSSEIAKRMNVHVRSPAQLFVLARDQAFFKVQFFGGDRAGDLGRMKTKEILYFPGKKALHFNHTLTKSLRDGTQMFLLSSVMQTLPFARSLQLRFTLAYATC